MYFHKSNSHSKQHILRVPKPKKSLALHTLVSKSEPMRNQDLFYMYIEYKTHVITHFANWYLNILFLLSIDFDWGGEVLRFALYSI